MKVVNAVHSGKTGDAIFSLPLLHSLHLQGSIINLWLDPTPTIDHSKHGDELRWTKEQAEMLQPLMSVQVGIAKCEVGRPEKIQLNLDLFRYHPDLAHGTLPSKYLEFFNGRYDLSDKWLWIPAGECPGYICVSRTPRYRHPQLDYRILNRYDHQIRFLGLPQEYEEFKKSCPLAQHYEIANFYQAAEIIAESSLFIGNPSAMFAIAEGLKVPRILESYHSNIIPMGGDLAGNATDRSYFEFLVNDWLKE